RGSAVVVPLLGRYLLVVPGVGAIARVQRDDRAQKQVVATLRAAKRLRVRRAVTGTDIHQVELGVVDDRVPVVATTADFPPLPGPGLGGHRHDRVGRGAFGHFRGVAGDEIELPRPFAGARVIGTDVSAGAEVAPGVADDHLS